MRVCQVYAYDKLVSRFLLSGVRFAFVSCCDGRFSDLGEGIFWGVLDSKIASRGLRSGLIIRNYN